MSLMTDYLKGRQNPVTERSLETSERDLAALVDAVGAVWLKKAADHPLQRLWARADSLATTQLLTLGGAIHDLSSRYPSWVKHQVKAIKGGKGDRRGAVLELMALYAFQAGGQSARPTPRNHPGYDLTIGLGGGAVDVSLKNFGMSEAENAARRAWEGGLSSYLAARQAALPRTSGLLIEATRYPSDADWAQLTAAIPQLVWAPWPGGIVQVNVGEAWVVTQHPLPTRLGTYAGGQTSYQLVTLIPHHRNEHANLISYLDSALANARKHARQEADVARALFIRLRETAALDQYRQWAADYLAENADGPIDAVFFYQPTFAFTRESTHALHHAFVAVFGDSYLSWQGGRADRQLRMEVPIGLTGSPVDRQIQIGDQRIPIGPRYVFQRGELYIAFGGEGTVTLLAPGIHQHAVLSFGDGAGITLRGKFPPGDALDLFD
jgi:hypothetical protein